MTAKNKEDWMRDNRIFNCICTQNLTYKQEREFENWINTKNYFVFAPIPSVNYSINYFFSDRLGARIELPQLNVGFNTFLLPVTYLNNFTEEWAFRVFA